MDGDLLAAVVVISDGCTIHQDDIAKIDAQVVIQHAADDAVTRAQAFDPYGLLRSRIISVGGALGERPFGELDLA